jgi:MEMO1 family protein
MTATRKAVARNFYPGDCAAEINGFLSGFKPPEALPERLIGGVVPHAGWSYSGATAARTLYTLSRHIEPESCIVFGADHTGLHRPGIYPKGAWATPLGELRIDEVLSDAILDQLPELVTADPNDHQYEHSIEVISPMLKQFWPALPFVPIIVPAVHSSVILGKSLGELVLKLYRPTLFLASSDLTHYGMLYDFDPLGEGADALQWMKHNDRRMIERLLNLDENSIVNEARSNRNACGSGALAALLAALSIAGVKKGYLIEYTTSFDSEPGEVFSTGVGYAGIVY